MASLPRGYVTLGDAVALAAKAHAGATLGRAPEGDRAAGRAVLRQLLIGGAVEAIVMPRRRKARAVPMALWSTGYAATMFDTGAAEFSDSVGAAAGTIAGCVMVPRRALAAALREGSGRTGGTGRVGRAEILAAFQRLCEVRLVSFDRGGQRRAAETLAWSFPTHKAPTIAGIIRSAYAARRDAEAGGAAARPRTRNAPPRRVR